MSSLAIEEVELTGYHDQMMDMEPKLQLVELRHQMLKGDKAPQNNLQEAVTVIGGRFTISF